MNNTFINKNLNTLKSENLDWNSIQIEMKEKLGNDIYESWLKKINLVEELMDNMKKVGFTKCDYRNLSGGIVAIHSGWKI